MISEMLNKDIRQTIQRPTTGQSVFKGMGTSAPTFGMIGILIGLVQMPASIGPSIAKDFDQYFGWMNSSRTMQES